MATFDLHTQNQNLADWYGALREENCVNVNKLLKNDPKLLKEGWIAETDASPQLQLPRGWKARTAVHVAARRGDVELMKLIVEEYSKILDEGDDHKGAYSRLLEVVDDDYLLDALAMAVVNGNQDIIDLLTISRQPSDSRSTPSDQGDENERTTHRNSVQKITEEALMPLEKKDQLHQMYEQDCDFNFLPIHLYFFHFTFSTWESSDTSWRDPLIKDIQHTIYLEASQSADTLKYLLCDLWDGQGRTPLHVAVDSGKVKKYLDVIPPPEIGVHPDYFLNNTDSAGRTPLYRAAAQNHKSSVKGLLVDSRTKVLGETKFSADQWGPNVDIDVLSWKNGFKSECVYVTEEKLRRKAFNNEGNAQGGPGPFIDPLIKISSTALHVAIIHKHKSTVDLLLADKRKEGGLKETAVSCGTAGKTAVTKDAGAKASSTDSPGELQANVYCLRRFTWPVSVALEGDSGIPYRVQGKASPLQLAVLVGNIPILQSLLKEKDARPELEDPAYSSAFSTGIQSFLLAAAKGAPGTIKAFLDRKKGNFNPLITDNDRNTALHHALKGKDVKFDPHLIDFVGCRHVYNWRWTNNDWVSQWLGNPEEAMPESKPGKHNPKEAVVKRIYVIANPQETGPEMKLEIEHKKSHKEKYGQRMGAINLLLEAGINIWDQNQQGRRASPEPEADDEFVKWWYEKVSEEMQKRQEKLNAAANAISVTAALVATASYVGPVTPPLGYSDVLGVQVNILAVRMFVVCDCLSFYFALAAIMLALLPSLPLAQDSMFRELVRTRILVAISVTFLFPSIICVLLAFIAGYVAVIPDQGFAYHGLTISTTIVGGVLCLFVIFSFLWRLVRVLKTLPADFERETDKYLPGPLKFISSCFEES